MKVAINGFGRIGRNVFRIIEENKDIEVVAINDLVPNSTLAHLLKYDSLYGIFDKTVSYDNKNIIVDNKKIKVFEERNPENLPWKEIDVDFVVESTGIFRTKKEAEKHIKAGAKKVIISAPAKDKIDATIVLGVNDDKIDKKNHKIISNASCTTNCLAPIVKIINNEFGIKKAMMTTIHSYTNDQKMLDLPHKDLRRARAGALSIIPTTTGAAKAVAEVIPDMKGKIDGMAMRVPTPTVSIVDLVAELNNNTDKKTVNEILKNESNKISNILGFENGPLVSMDFKGDSRSSIIDGLSTNVIGGNMVKIVSWYDNEWGYSNRVVDLIEKYS